MQIELLINRSCVLAIILISFIIGASGGSMLNAAAPLGSYRPELVADGPDDGCMILIWKADFILELPGWPSGPATAERAWAPHAGKVDASSFLGL
jgi:hypothetical protein